jgi:beta-1,4-mannosyl-glycoprotein beta-1,4-N-acetylglucosaminyltransferase
MVYDCFNFFNELDLLEIRLNELDDLVDKFVLVESTVTFTNKPKPLYFSENKSRYKKYLKKIIHVVVNDSPNVIGNPWIIEAHQFNAITRGLKNCTDNDVILLSNADEIPDKNLIRTWIDKPGKIKVCRQILCYYYLDLQVENSPWLGTRIIKYADLLTYPNPYIVRHSPTDRVITNGGWHFSYLGGIEKIREKIFAFSHQEYNNPNFNTPEKIAAALLSHSDLFGRNLKFRIMDHGQLPEYIKNNIYVYQKLFTPDKKIDSVPKNKLIFIDQIKNTLRRIRS